MRSPSPAVVPLCFLAACAYQATDRERDSGPADPEPEPDTPPADTAPHTGAPTDTGPVPPLELDPAQAAHAVIHGHTEAHFLGDGIDHGDVTGDGELDLVASSASRVDNCSYVFAGPFLGDIPTTDAIAVVPGGSFGVEIGDFDADGQGDLAVHWSGPLALENEYHLYFGPLSPAAPPAAPHAVVRPGRGNSTAYACDANRDGAEDLVFTDDLDAVFFTMGPLPRHDLGEEALHAVFEGDVDLASPSPSASSIGCGRDITGDGVADLLLADDYQDSDVWLIEDPSWDGWFKISEVGTRLSLQSNGAVVVASDLTGDGQPDLYVDGGNIVEGPVDATSTPYATYAWGGATRSVPVGDLDGDGADDLVGGSPYERPGAVFLLFGPVSPGTYEEDDTDVILTLPDLSGLGFHLAADPQTGLWAAGAAGADGDAWDEGQVFLYDGVPGL